MERETAMSAKHFVFGALVLACASVFAIAAQQGSEPRATPYKAPTRNHTGQPQDDGARAFKQNCSRCHNAPEGFSPRISGAIVRHMRVRAALSQQDEEALLRFFNP
jgi:cytochrome c5